MEVFNLVKYIMENETAESLSRAGNVIECLPEGLYKQLCFSYLWEHYSCLIPDRYYNNKREYAVIYSPGYGGGWSTWLNEDDCPNSTCHPTLVQAILNGKARDLKKAADELWGPDPYYPTDEELQIKWVPWYKSFEIREYDGFESVHIY